MAERMSPSADRVVLILGLLAEHPAERLTLTEIATRLGLSKPTCLGVLGSLTAGGLLTRDEDKAYALGPALLRMGSAAENSVAPLDLMRPYLDGLHGRLRAGCLIVGNVENDMVVLDRRGTLAEGDARDFVGERFPLVPPLGLVNHLWNPDGVLEDWLAREPLVRLDPEPGRLAAVAAGARERGYVVERAGGPTDIGHAVVAQLVSSHLPEPVLRRVCAHLPPTTFREYEVPGEEDPRVPVSSISAPVFDRRGRQRYLFTAVLDRKLSPAEREDATAAVVAAGRASTEALGGHNPWDTAAR
ncbi:IclR family transcriptional regulator [Streptodolium elevatio]|uniref:Helix-turn-helix domain-containing protein n=1 Tax=Streptodolium elevatio TaxID=3157996 RepID=A0ABV3DML5_9ACTN